LIWRSKRLMAFSQPPPQRASSLAPTYRVRQLLGWLCCQIIKRRPPKANSRPPITLLFNTLNLLALTKEPTEARAILMPCTCNIPMVSHGTMIRGQPLSYPWRQRAKLLEGRTSAAHFCCRVFVVFVCVCPNIYLANWLVETWSGTSQNGQFLCNHNIKTQSNFPNVRHVSNLSALQD